MFTSEANGGSNIADPRALYKKSGHAVIHHPIPNLRCVLKVVVRRIYHGPAYTGSQLRHNALISKSGHGFASMCVIGFPAGFPIRTTVAIWLHLSQAAVGLFILAAKRSSVTVWKTIHIRGNIAR
jgi:hypothetical protein